MARKKKKPEPINENQGSLLDAIKEYKAKQHIDGQEDDNLNTPANEP